MDQRISFVTFAVRDLEATKAFYVDGLGWEPAMDVPGEVLMIKVGEHVLLVAVGRGGVRGRGRPDPARPRSRAVLAGPQRGHPRGGRRRTRDRPPRRRRPRLARVSSGSGVGTPDTSATPTASAGRSRGTRARSDRRFCHDRQDDPHRGAGGGGGAHGLDVRERHAARELRAPATSPPACAWSTGSATPPSPPTTTPTSC